MFLGDANSHIQKDAALYKFKLILDIIKNTAKHQSEAKYFLLNLLKQFNTFYSYILEEAHIPENNDGNFEVTIMEVKQFKPKRSSSIICGCF